MTNCSSSPSRTIIFCLVFYHRNLTIVTTCAKNITTEKYCRKTLICLYYKDFTHFTLLYTVLSCLDQFPIWNCSVSNILRTNENLEIGNWVKTRQNCLVLSPLPFTPPTRTRQNSFVLSMLAVWGIKLWESHWWPSFWVFWSACFTVERSTYRTVTASVRRPRGGRPL